MKIGRTIPPAASPIPVGDILRAMPACFGFDTREEMLKQEIEQEFNCRHSFLLSSGKAALTVILLALKKIYPGRDKVLIPAYTCYSVPAAIKRAGLEVQLVDLAANSLDVDKEALFKIVEVDRQKKRILCIVPTHLFGSPSDIVGIKNIVGSDVVLVEDAAQAMGESMNSCKLGTLGDVGFFSLGRGKALSTMGGGVIVTNREDLADTIRPLVNSMMIPKAYSNLLLALKSIMTSLFQHPALFWLPKFAPFLQLGETIYDPEFSMYQFSAFQRKLTVDWQKRLRSHQDARHKNINYWQKNLPEIFTLLPGVCRSSMIRFPVLLPTRDAREYALQKSEQQGLGLMPGYPTIIRWIPEIADEFSGQVFCRAEGVCARILTIPVHEYVKQDDNVKILIILKKSVEQYNLRQRINTQGFQKISTEQSDQLP